tara:strand:+ start:1167 stop:1451 length:285 start_codon:yes stop_codon:yes gene_type:complete
MKKLLLILIALPMVGFASFPIITDTKKCESITVPLDYDVNQKTDNENSRIEIINSPLEKDDPWNIIKWLSITFGSLFLLLLIVVVIALALADLN